MARTWSDSVKVLCAPENDFILLLLCGVFWNVC